MIACVGTIFNSFSDAKAEIFWENDANGHVADVLTLCVENLPAANDKEWAGHCLHVQWLPP